MYQRILVAVDGSEPAGWAVESGQALAAAVGARLAVVHVVDPADPGASPGGAGRAVAPDALRAMRRDGRRLLRQVQGGMPPGRLERAILKEGPAAEQVLAAAREWGADLIVMGAHGRARLVPFLLGSTADAAAREADCPVMVVARRPRPAGEPRRPPHVGAGAGSRTRGTHGPARV